MTFKGAVLALDLASSTGWAYGKPGGKPVFGSHRLAKPGTSRACLYHHFRLWLDCLASSHPPNLIVYESPVAPMLFRGATNIETTRMLTGFAEHLEEWAYLKCELREASVSQVRAHFIGRNFKTAIAMPKVMQRCADLGWIVKNDDEADAAALWDYQCSFLRPDLAHKTTPLFARGAS